MAIRVMSDAFAEGQPIPAKYTCDGQDISPPLRWTGIPTEARELALVVDDPDAPSGLFTHWLVYGLPPQTTGLPEGVPPGETVSGGGRQGRNDFGRIGYGGPCPPSGSHRYVFTVYALDAPLGLPAGATRRQLFRAMEGHVIDKGQLIGRYQRR
jgi:Raf kinase inhibitor-like YbhB/YbcL family protein